MTISINSSNVCVGRRINNTRYIVSMSKSREAFCLTNSSIVFAYTIS